MFTNCILIYVSPRWLVKVYEHFGEMLVSNFNSEKKCSIVHLKVCKLCHTAKGNIPEN